MSSLLKDFVAVAPRRASVSAHTRRAARVVFLILFTFAVPATVAAVNGDARAIRDEDVRRAEKILLKLRLLHEAAAAGDASAYRKLTSRLYPGLFIKVAEMRPSNLSTDLSTAVFLAEKLGRNWASAEATAADCEGERPDIYQPLCLELRGGTTRQLLLVKSRLHARWAEASVNNSRGETGAETARALAEMKAARVNDTLIAALVVKELKTVEELLSHSQTSTSRGERLNTRAPADKPSGDFAEALRVSEILLAWMPRSQTFYHLSGARLAYADGLSWYEKAQQSKSLVVSAKQAFLPDQLKDLRLDAEQVSNTAQANWRSATKYTRLAEQSLSRPIR
jgi:hypothetical protein